MTRRHRLLPTHVAFITQGVVVCSCYGQWGFGGRVGLGEGSVSIGVGVETQVLVVTGDYPDTVPASTAVGEGGLFEGVGAWVVVETSGRVVRRVVFLVLLVDTELSTRLQRFRRRQVLIEPIPLASQPRVFLLLFRLGLEILNNTLHRQHRLTQPRRQPAQRLLHHRHLNLPRLPILLKVLIKLLQRLLIILLVNRIISDQAAQALLAFKKGDLLIQVADLLVDEPAGVDRLFDQVDAFLLVVLGYLLD